MKILALEFSSPQRSVAVLEPADDASLNARSNEALETGANSTNAFEMIQRALRLTQLEREQIDCLAIGLGPGSYTGIRASIALAQGWQFARDVKLVGISSAECIAAQAGAENVVGRVAVIIDAQRDEFYLAVFDVNSEDARELEPLRLASFAEVEKCQRAGNLLIGPEATNWFASGRMIFPRAVTVGRLALRRTNVISGERMEPIYLRETKFVKAPPPRILR